MIQGPPGAGKSSFTLHLANELIKQELQPIRIALRDVQFRESLSVASALPEAVRLGDGRQRAPTKDLYANANLFRDDAIFEQAVAFRGVRICRYVLILDGWDEISVGASASYLERVELLLREVRQRFLERRAFPLRVILTGRPSDAIEQSGFLRKETVLLTIRSFTPEQLESYVARIRGAVINQRRDDGRARLWRGWEDEARWAGIVTHYRRASEEFWRRFEPSYGSIEVLGIPLLAYLSLRLVAMWPGDVSRLLEDSTAVLRSLIALVIGQGGKPEEDEYPLEGRPVMAGDTLRALLHRTARTMTILGRESVSYGELMHELAFEESTMDLQLCNLDKQILSRLVISFFFRGGRRDLGCEFTHKSFREYLFAESLVELLKEYGRQESEGLSERSAGQLWKDFATDDPRYSFCRELAEMLGPLWMSQEIANHVLRLVSWEIARAVGNDRLPEVGLQTKSLAISAWERIRDALADAWDWWMSETHLRPQLRARSSEGRKDDAFEVVSPMAFNVIARQGHEPPTPSSFRPQSAGSLDARLGDGLFRLSAIVHAELAIHQGYRGATSVRQGQVLEPGQGVRRYQSCVRTDHGEWVLFSPFGREPQSLPRVLARINAGDNRPVEAFPAGVAAQYVDLRGLEMRAMELRYTELRGANLAGANLYEAILSKEGYCGADGEGGPDLRDVIFRETKLWHANLTLADLRGADLSGAMVSKGTLHSAVLDGAFGLDEIEIDEEEEVNS